MSEMDFSFLQAIHAVFLLQVLNGMCTPHWFLLSLYFFFLTFPFPVWFMYSFKVRESVFGLKGHQRLLPRILS